MKKQLITLIGLMIFLTGSAQSTWYEVDLGTEKQLNTIEFVTPLVGYIGGNDSLLLKTTNGGITWEEVEFTGVEFFALAEHITNLDFVSEDIGYMAVGPYYGVYKTTDGGLTWNLFEEEPSMCYNQALYFESEDNGFIGGSGCFMGEMIRKFEDGSASITSLEEFGWSAEEMIVDIDMGGSYGLAVSAGGRIFRSSDNGETWDKVHTDTVPLTAVLILDENTAYVGRNNAGIHYGGLITEDGGLTWDILLPTATLYFPGYLSLLETPNGNLYFGGVGAEGVDPFLNGALMENDGDGWHHHVLDEAIHSLAYSTDEVVWGVGDSGYVIVNVPPTELNIEEDRSKELFAYPNPVNDVLYFDQVQSSVQVFNLQGQLVAAENASDRIQMESLPSGIYVLKSGHARKIITKR